MDWKLEWKALSLITLVFLAVYFLPVDNARFGNAVFEALQLLKWYAREHVILCLLPAFFIAGAISVFVRRESVLKYLGAKANKILAYGVASVSGTILTVCSCTVLPLFAGIYRMGAGLGPATAFLYSGPAINALAIILTARILGLKLGLARAIGAILFSIIIGLLMHLFFRKEESDRQKQQLISSADSDNQPLYQTALYFAAMLAILIFANWSHPPESVGFWNLVYSAKWIIVAICALLFALILHFWFALKWWKISLAAVPAVILAFVFPHQPVVPFAAAILGLGVITAADKGDCGEWFDQTWIFAKQIMPLLLGGILVAGFLLGRPGNEGIIPSSWVVGAVGGNSLWANLFASVAGAFMYFATLTEIPILQGLIGGGMGQGPALALLLAGPALSLPSMLVIRSIMGTKKTLIFILLVIVMSTAIGLIYGTLA